MTNRAPSIATDDSQKMRTFLSCSVVLSSAMQRRSSAELVAAMDLHDDILCRAIHSHNGHLFLQTSDGSTALFDSPTEAVEAAISALRDMQQADWGNSDKLSIRAGIHTGLSRPRGNDYFGPAMPVVNRLESAANPNQILLSDAACDGVIQDARRFAVKALGEYHFKGIAQMQVYQVVADQLPRQFDELGGKRESSSGNLPARINSFLGRQTELDELQELAAQSRLLTLLGPGGIGKTDLALELARSISSDFADGSWLVELSNVESDYDLWPTIADALQLPPSQSVTPEAQVIDHLRRATALLLIDNCEHVIDPIAEITTQLAERCEHLVIISTSRRVLGVDGETIYEVPSMGPSQAGQLSRAPAIDLFVERAQRLDAGFNPNPTDLQLIDEICATLEYLPLAVEIAASQVRRLALPRLLNLAATPLELLPQDADQLTTRHQSLRQTLDWSWQLLDDTSRQVWATLSVFSGTIDEQLGVSVCDNNADDIHGSIDELMDSSLLTIDNDTRRLRMLDSVQAYGREKLAAEQLAIEQRYCQVYAEHCGQLTKLLNSAKEEQAVASIYDELPNLRSAFDRALEQHPDIAEELTKQLFPFNYFHRGAETGQWGRRFVDATSEPQQPLKPYTLTAAAMQALHISVELDVALDLATRAIQTEQSGAAATHGWAQHIAAQIALWAGQPKQCISHQRRAINEARANDNQPCEIISMALLPAVLMIVGDNTGAKAMIDELSERESAIEQPTLVGYTYFARGNVARSLGDTDQALEQYRIALDFAMAGGNHQGAERCARHIADVRASQVEPSEAIGIYIESLTGTQSESVHAWWIVRSLLKPLCATGQHHDVVLLAGALRESQMRLDRDARETLDTSRQQLNPQAYQRQLKLGAQLPLTEIKRKITSWAS